MLKKITPKHRIYSTHSIVYSRCHISPNSSKVNPPRVPNLSSTFKIQPHLQQIATFKMARLSLPTLLTALISTAFIATTVDAQCGGDSGYCCLKGCQDGCVNGFGEVMCHDCVENFDLTVCICGCYDSGLHCGVGGRNNGGLSDTHAVLGLGGCGC